MTDQTTDAPALPSNAPKENGTASEPDVDRAGNALPDWSIGRLTRLWQTSKTHES